MGRMSLFLVMGFNILFGLMGFNLSRVSIAAVENHVTYYSSTQAHNIASSAANLACNQLFLNPSWREGYSSVPFSDGEFSVRVEDLAGHYVRLLVNAEYGDQDAGISVLFGPSSFSKFAYYSVVEGGIYWITGDTVWGPWHSQSKLTVHGDPVFYGKATMRIGLFKNPASSDPKFYGGFETGVSVELPNDMSELIAAAQSGGRSYSDTDLWLRFNANGTVTYKTTAAGPESTAVIETFAPNGVILANRGNLHIKGTVNGRVTVAATGSSGMGYGNVILDDDIVYAQDPLSGSCDDILGICSENSVVIANNTANNSDINIHGSVFCRTGGFTAEAYNTRPISGTIRLVGGIQQYQREPVGQFLSGSIIVHGFQKNYRYDERLMYEEPPFYPHTRKLEILSWYE
jgi:hypothetical protein